MDLVADPRFPGVGCILATRPAEAASANLTGSASACAMSAWLEVTDVSGELGISRRTLELASRDSSTRAPSNTCGAGDSVPFGESFWRNGRSAVDAGAPVLPNRTGRRTRATFPGTTRPPSASCPPTPPAPRIKPGRRKERAYFFCFCPATGPAIGGVSKKRPSSTTRGSPVARSSAINRARNPETVSA